MKVFLGWADQDLRLLRYLLFRILACFGPYQHHPQPARRS